MDQHNFSEYLKVLKNIYNAVRIVDPVHNVVVCTENVKPLVSINQYSCYDFWEKGKFCDNCISLRALREKDTFVKFEVAGNRLYMITASALGDAENFYVVEMINDITDKSIFEGIVGANKDIKDFTNLVLKFNDVFVRDELTKIFNRRFINERLPVEIINNVVMTTPAVLIMIDIDQFKLVNDNYGHIAGDAILQQFAKLLTEAVPSNKDWVSRYGGEEFLFYLYNTSGSQALEFAEQLRNVVEKFEFTISQGFINITCSLGISLLQKEMNMQAWIDKADKNLYVAKLKGGNKVILEEYSLSDIG